MYVQPTPARALFSLIPEFAVGFSVAADVVVDGRPLCADGDTVTDELVERCHMHGVNYLLV